ncbi:energy transducer TonB [Allorhodopirellula solitaria]|uniref:energy transducer TonB n=1 Tax=Allorhodopirellula solitaria TaxID=2527987 RepID=UPI001648923B|nr:energy transducer TonB [Allorhodopirellula solitaria]
MNRSISNQRSTFVSLAAHAVVTLGLMWIPVSALERFRTSGQRQVIAIEMTLGAAGSTADSPPESVKLPAEISEETAEEKPVKRPVELLRTPPPKRTDLDQRREMKRLVRADNGLDRMKERLPALDAARQETIPSATQDAKAPLERVATSAERPTVSDIKPKRPRRRRATTAMATVATPAVNPMAGLEATEVEFDSNPMPEYPAAAVAQRLEGTTMLRLSIDRQGRVRRAVVLRSSGSQLLDEAALAAVSKWHGKPATRFGVPIETEEVLPIRFRL